MELWQFKQRQLLSLSEKESLSRNRIREWYDFYGGNVYVSFSGGKDSTVLLHLVRSIYPEVPAVFADTGLEFPEVRDFVLSTKNTTILKPKKNFVQIVEEYGYPIISKDVSSYVEGAKKGYGWAIRGLMYGKDENSPYDGPSYTKGFHKYKYLVDAPFKISAKCCYWLKKAPFSKHNKETGLYPFIGTMASESRLRRRYYLKNGCNSFDIGKSTPLSFWTEENIWEYIEKYSVPYAKKYYDLGYTRTGCMFCMFGIEFDEPSNNRFIKMKKTHPNLYKYCMEKLGCKKVLDYINISKGIVENQ